jgi:ABC-type transport system involved in multi-copper enzyme maturation permease subunit
MQVLLVSFVAPTFTVGAISGERERQTFDLLRTTTLTPPQITWSKFIAALGFTLLLIFATLPLFSLAFLLGGVDPVELVITLCIVFSSAFLFTLLGIYISSRSKTTMGAVVVTYAIVLGIVVGIPLASLIGSSTIQLALAPLGASAGVHNEFVVAAFETLLAIAISLSPISAIVASQRFFAVTGNLWTFNPSFISSGLSVTLPAPFVILTVVYLIVSGVLFILTVRRIARADQV